MRRVGFYVDGFNLYHALDDLKAPHLKWLDIFSLAERIIAKRDEQIVRIVYCSAFPTHLSDRSKLERHKSYIAALEFRGVECILGRFKKRPLTRCRSCHHSWQSHEEKESDVNLALELLYDVLSDRIDRAYLLSGDSDFAGLARMLHHRCPDKELVSVATPHRTHSNDVLRYAHGKRKITVSTLEACLLPQHILDPAGRKSRVTRPSNYDPPSP